jgi:hypothetical protein
MPNRESIDSQLRKTLKSVRASLKERGIDVPEVDGPSDDPHLRSLQEWQALQGALKPSEDSKSAYTAGTDFTASADKVTKGK